MSQRNLVSSFDKHDNSTLLANKQSANNPNNQVTTPVTLIDPREIEVAFARIQAELPGYDDERLIQLAISAQIFERCAFKLRGMIAHELQRRVTQRLNGGRGNCDRERTGIKSKMYELAEQVNVSYSTLANDARIYRTFFLDQSQTMLAGERTLPRDFYLTALGLSALGEEKPIEAIRVAAQRLDEGIYTREDFRNDVRKLANAETSVIKSKQSKENYLLRERVTYEVRQALEELTEATNQTSAEVIGAAILAQLRSLKRKSDKPKSSPTKHSDKSETALNNDVLELDVDESQKF